MCKTNNTSSGYLFYLIKNIVHSLTLDVLHVESCFIWSGLSGSVALCPHHCSILMCCLGWTQRGICWTGTESAQWWAALKQFPTITTVLRQRELHRWLLGCKRHMHGGVCLLPLCLHLDPAIEKSEVNTDPVRDRGTAISYGCTVCCNGFNMVPFSAWWKVPCTCSPNCTHTSYTLTSCLSHEGPLLFCQLNRHSTAKIPCTPLNHHHP